MKAKRVFLIILIGLTLWMAFSIWKCSYQKSEARKNVLFGGMILDNPGSENMKVIVDEDTILVPLHSVVCGLQFRTRKQPHRLLAYNEKGSKICDTSFFYNDPSRFALINPLSNTYIFWKIRYSQRPDLEQELDSNYMQPLLIDSEVVYGNFKKNRSHIILCLMDFRGPDRSVPQKIELSGHHDNTATYTIRQQDFLTVYGNLHPVRYTTKLYTSLHNLASVFLQKIDLRSKEVKANKEFSMLVNSFGGTLPEGYVKSWKKDKETFRKYDPELYDKLIELEERFEKAPKEEGNPEPKKFLHETIQFHFGYYRGGFLNTKLFPLRQVYDEKLNVRYYKLNGCEEFSPPVQD